jgi:hypothetical protein
MGMKINNYAINQAEKGTIIYTANERIDSICIILKGRVLAVNDGSKVLLGSGSFIGVIDLYMGRFLNSYIAYDDVTFYCFPIERKDELMNIMKSGKDYKGLIVASLTKYLSELDKVYNSLRSNAEKLYSFLHSNYEVYQNTGKKLGYPIKSINVIEEMTPYDSDFKMDEKKLEYYKEGSRIPLDVWKTFCASSDTMAFYIIEEVSVLITSLVLECTELSSYLVELFAGLMNSSDLCLFKCSAALAISIEETGGYNNEVISTIDQLIDEINSLEKLFDEKTGYHLSVDRSKMEEIYYMLLSNDTDRKEQVDNNFKYSQDEVQQVQSDLNNSLIQILSYGKLEETKAIELEQHILDFMNLKDKNSVDDGTRLLRKKISEQFYQLYELVFFRAMEDKQRPKVVDLFLKYGFIDERLLTKEQLKELYYLETENQVTKGPCNIYNIKEWLTLIYKGEKEPSKNDFDMDYTDNLRDQRKRGVITEAEEKVLQTDITNKVTYEIHNMFRYNHRVVQGQISTFVPFLWSDNLTRGINKLYLSANQINQVISELLEVDYSIFHREALYVNNEKGISKEYIMSQIYPDIILMPTVGYNGVMWQEISGKRKSSAGRFLLPTFSEVSIKEVLVRVFGRFRWELCRSIQGSAWNSIKYKSLTSEYSDYIQFYRKNRDLSEEVKEKLKLQIQKGKGNLREIFVLDYETWIRGEANGAIRLNKVVREILATYIPFGSDIRSRLVGQPLFADAMQRFGRNTVKKIKDLESRYRAIEKDGGELTEELMETLIFYRDL